MSTRYTITLHASYAEECEPETPDNDDPPPKFLGILNRWLDERRVTGLTMLASPGYVTGAYICSMQSRGNWPLDGFIQMVMDHPWAKPESVVLIVLTEECGARVFVP